LISQGGKVVEAVAGSEAGEIASAVHHVGVSVASLDQALGFWESFLGRKASWRTILDRPYLAQHVGIPGVSIDAAFVDLPGGIILELLDYQTADKRANPTATPNPGNVHLCLAVEDADFAWRRAVESGAQPVRRQGPVDIDAGPNVGARAAYLRIHDGVTLELFQRPANPREKR
jgi:catechol 2,3-dioxygenase-like lactoylglutathione lyase family enzyme